jgi:hypothetical protein
MGSLYLLHRGDWGGATIRTLHVLLFERGIIPHLEMAAFGIGLGMLFLRIPLVFRDHGVLSRVSVALARDRGRGGRSAQPAIDVLDQEPQKTLTSTVCRRLITRATTAAEPAELDAFIDQISDLERRKVEASHESVRYIIYLIPTLGFTGTVLGISDAVVGFSGVVGTNADAATLQRTLIEICTNLGVSFDTTLIALVLSAILALLKAGIDRGEMLLASAVDDLAISQLRPVLDIAPARASGRGWNGIPAPRSDESNSFPETITAPEGSPSPVLLLQNPDGSLTNIREVADQIVRQVLEEQAATAEAKEIPDSPEGMESSLSALHGRRLVELLEAKTILAEQVARHLRDSAVRREDAGALREAILSLQTQVDSAIRMQSSTVETLTHLVQDLQRERAARQQADQQLTQLLEALRRDGIPAKVRLFYHAEQAKD